MDYRILGPLEVAEGDRAVVLGRGRQRSVLALLLLHANEVVASERLIDELWGDAPPPTAAKTVQVYVSQLRKSLRNGDAEGPLLTRGSGYVLELAAGELDLHRFERALADGRRALDADAPDVAADTLRNGLAMWRGPPLADFTYEPFAQGEIARLEELRLEAVEQRIEADLELGRHEEVVGELETLVGEHPMREGLRGRLMLALYRCDRQAEALEAYRRGRHLLIEELGIEPSSSLRRLHEQILAQDPALGAPGRAHRPPRPRRLPPTAAVVRRPLVLVGVGLALLAAVAIVVVLQVVRDPGPAPPAIPLTYSALAVMDAAGRTVDDAVSLPGAGRVAMDGGVVWAANDDSGTVSAVDQRTRRVERTVATGIFPSDIAAGAGAIWVVDGSQGRLAWVDESYDELRTLDYRPSGLAPPDRFGFDPTSIAVGEDAVWITDGGRRLLRVDPDAAAGAEAVPTGRRLVAVAVGEGSVWAISGDTARLLRIDPSTNAITMRLPLVDAPDADSAFPRALAVGAGYVWVLNGNTGAVTKIDPDARSVVGTIKIGVERLPVQLAVDGDALWVANQDGTLARVDAATEDVEFHDVGRMLHDVAAGDGDVWVTNRLADCCGRGF